MKLILVIIVGGALTELNRAVCVSNRVYLYNILYLLAYCEQVTLTMLIALYSRMLIVTKC